MKPNLRSAPVIAMAFAALLQLSGCGKNLVQVDPSERLCGGNAGFGAIITGTAEPVEMCLPDDNTVEDIETGVQATYDPSSHSYVLTATFESDGLTHTIQIGFRVHAFVPLSLNVTQDSTRAFAASDGAWISYRETRPGAYEYVSTSVSGVFTLTFSDSCIATATFRDVAIDLEDTATHASAGTRTISEGFLGVTRDIPGNCP